MSIPTTTTLLLSLRQSALSRPTEVAISETRSTAIASLTRRLAAGEEEAFRTFHELYFDRLYEFLLVVTRGEPQQAEDALQETLLRVVRHARVFTDEEAFWCWLKAIARSAARDAGRKQHRYLRLLERFALWRRHDETRPESNADLQLMLAECLDQLDPGERALIQGKYLKGASVRELAAETGLTEKAVESRLGRVRRELRQQLLKRIASL